MNLRQKAVKGFVWSAIQSWGRQAIALIVFSILARLVAPEAFGLIALAQVFLAFTQVFLDQGFTEAIVQRHDIEPEHLDTAFWINLVIGLLLTVFGIAGAGLVADLFNQPQLTPIIRWLSPSFLIFALSAVQEAIFTRNLAFKTLAVRSLIAVVAGGLVGVAMAFRGYGVWSLVGQQLAGGLVQILVLWWGSDWRPGFKVSARHFRELFSFGINVVWMKILDFINYRADDFLIGYFLGPVALGYYSIAFRLFMIMIQLLTNVTNQVAIPAFSRMQQETERLRQAFYTVTELTGFISFPAFLGVVALAPEIIRLLFGEKWLPSIPVLQLLALVGIFNSIYYFNATVIIAMGKPFWKVMLNLMNVVATLVFFAIAVRWDIVAVAAACVLRFYLLAPIELGMVKKLINIKYTTYLRQCIAPLTGSLVMVATIMVLKHFLSGLISLYAILAVCILLGTVAYTLVILLMAPTLTRKILDLVASLVPIKKN